MLSISMRLAFVGITHAYCGKIVYRRDSQTNEFGSELVRNDLSHLARLLRTSTTTQTLISKDENLCFISSLYQEDTAWCLQGLCCIETSVHNID